MEKVKIEWVVIHRSGNPGPNHCKSEASPLEVIRLISILLNSARMNGNKVKIKIEN